MYIYIYIYIYIQLPDEDRAPGEEGMCGKLLLSMYGTRDAAQHWHNEYASTLIDAGFERGVANPCLFKNKSGTTSVMVHGDDFVAVGPETEVKEVENALAHKYKIKVETLGLGEGDKKEIRVLNRVIRMSKNDGVSLEADPRHAERVIREMGVEEAKASPMPGTKGEAKKATEKEEEDEEEPKELDQKDASRYRGVAATLNYLAADRADIQFATKEAARAMAKPTENDWILVRKIARYLEGRPRTCAPVPLAQKSQDISVYIVTAIMQDVGKRGKAPAGE